MFLKTAQDSCSGFSSKPCRHLVSTLESGLDYNKNICTLIFSFQFRHQRQTCRLYPFTTLNFLSDRPPCYPFLGGGGYVEGGDRRGEFGLAVVVSLYSQFGGEGRGMVEA